MDAKHFRLFAMGVNYYEPHHTEKRTKIPPEAVAMDLLGTSKDAKGPLLNPVNAHNNTAKRDLNHSGSVCYVIRTGL